MLRRLLIRGRAGVVESVESKPDQENSVTRNLSNILSSLGFHFPDPPPARRKSKPDQELSSRIPPASGGLRGRLPRAVAGARRPASGRCVTMRGRHAGIPDAGGSVVAASTWVKPARMFRPLRCARGRVPRWGSGASNRVPGSGVRITPAARSGPRGCALPVPPASGISGKCEDPWPSGGEPTIPRRSSVRSAAA